MSLIITPYKTGFKGTLGINGKSYSVICLVRSRVIPELLAKALKDV
jgi:hypothetical protein